MQHVELMMLAGQELLNMTHLKTMAMAVATLLKFGRTLNLRGSFFTGLGQRLHNDTLKQWATICEQKNTNNSFQNEKNTINSFQQHRLTRRLEGTTIETETVQTLILRVLCCTPR